MFYIYKKKSKSLCRDTPRIIRTRKQCILCVEHNSRNSSTRILLPRYRELFIYLFFFYLKIQQNICHVNLFYSLVTSNEQLFYFTYILYISNIFCIVVERAPRLLYWFWRKTREFGGHTLLLAFLRDDLRGVFGNIFIFQRSVLVGRRKYHISQLVIDVRMFTR